LIIEILFLDLFQNVRMYFDIDIDFNCLKFLCNKQHIYIYVCCPNLAHLIRHLLPFPLEMIMKTIALTFCHLSRGIKKKVSVEKYKYVFSSAVTHLQKVSPTSTKGVTHLQKMSPTTAKARLPFSIKGGLLPFQGQSKIQSYI